jgi:hypothetical protein
VKGGPSIAVMLGGGKAPDAAKDDGEPGLAEAKSSAKAAAKSLAQAVASKDADATYRAFRALSGLCKEIDELEDSGESDDEEPSSDDEAPADEG